MQESQPKRAIILLQKGLAFRCKWSVTESAGRSVAPVSHLASAGLEAVRRQAVPSPKEIPVDPIQPKGAGAEAAHSIIRFNRHDRRNFIGGSDARIIMGNNEDDLVRLWRQKRGELEPQDFSSNLTVQLGLVTEELNRNWYQRNTGQTVRDAQTRVRHPIHKWMAATLDGIVEPTGAVFEAKFMLPWAFTEETAAEKHMAQLQHNMWVTASRTAVLSIITGGGKWVEMTHWSRSCRRFGPPRSSGTKALSSVLARSWSSAAGRVSR